MSEQNIVFRAKSDKVTNQKHYEADPKKKIEKAEVGKLQVYGQERGKELQRLRSDKGLTQKELASKCNLDISVIRNYESGTALYKPNEVNKMAKVLGTTLQRPKRMEKSSEEI